MSAVAEPGADHAVPFTDVPPDHRFAEEIAWVGRLGLIDADGGRFRPTQSVTRRELAVALYRYAGAAESGPHPSLRAADLAVDDPDVPALAWAVHALLLPMHPDGTLRHERPATRVETVVALHRAAGVPAPTVRRSFRDVPDWHPGADALCWAAEVGVARGFPDGTFRPSRTLNRQAAAVLLHRFDGLD
jgi:hypothetical protein